MRVLITGATGFLGRQLIESLATEFQLVATSRTPVEFPLGVENRVVTSITAEDEWAAALPGIDTVVHLAARAHVMNETGKDPLTLFREVNVRGTVALAKACVHAGIKRFVFISSIKVNGERTTGTPYQASDPPAAVDPYGVSKQEAEASLYRLFADTGVELIVLRSPVIYGPNVKGNLKRILGLVRRGVPTPFGAVQNKRSMLSTVNAGTWIKAAISAPNPPPTAILMADPTPVSTKDLVHNIARGMGKKTLSVPVPTSFLKIAGTLFNQRNTIDRLIGDLEVTPTFDAFPGIELLMETPENGLQALGRFDRDNQITS